MNTSEVEQYEEYQKYINDATGINNILKEIRDNNDKVLVGVKKQNDYITHLQEQIVTRDKRIAELESGNKSRTTRSIVICTE